ncbi:MarR family winged helix-turn-helix transcriptional regulator [Frondihabitans australicus]|uniref:DNA-binding MarR family transcriptional regulator n=1 Tax=Frondihabitans australicus TaxID=386892 RepID=A0A495II73_9MICO|nr:MarR family transcriptional regulator [Frondihabitans australicus]RKR75687.1 DNA-binding MarR family transcriptional regulator [Frondihabitans australicus]
MNADANDGPATVPQLGAQVRTATALLYRRFRSERPEGELGDRALEVLNRLYKNGAQTLTELSRYERVSPASMSQSVNRLTEAGYAVRSPHPDDGRKVRFSTTAAGDEVARAAREQRNSWLDAQLATLPESDQEAVARAAIILMGIATSPSTAVADPATRSVDSARGTAPRAVGGRA